MAACGPAALRTSSGPMHGRWPSTQALQHRAAIAPSGRWPLLGLVHSRRCVQGRGSTCVGQAPENGRSACLRVSTTNALAGIPAPPWRHGVRAKAAPCQLHARAMASRAAAVRRVLPAQRHPRSVAMQRRGCVGAQGGGGGSHTCLHCRPAPGLATAAARAELGRYSHGAARFCAVWPGGCLYCW